MPTMHNPAHPGEVLLEYLPESVGISEAAKRLGVTRQALSAIVNGRAGIIARNARLRVIRDNRVIGDYGIESLKREKDDAREVRDGLECGIKLAGFNDLKEGDIFECYRVEEVARTLS